MHHNVDHGIRHPKIYQPSSEWSEAQKLHLVTPYSNPYRLHTRRNLFNDYRRHISVSPNVELYVTELAYGDRPFEVTEQSHPQDLQLRGDAEMFHKENLINLGVQRFPDNYQYGGYCDGDFNFTRHDWALEAVHLLQHYDFVQLFSSYADLSSHHRPVKMTPSFAWAFNHGQRGRGFYGHHGWYIGSPGGAWAWRRDAFDKVGGLLDICILGAADHHMAVGLCGGSSDHGDLKGHSPKYIEHISNWRERAARLTRGIGCVEGHAIHHWHGSRVNRAYTQRWQVLAENQYDPGKDICRNWQGVYHFTGNKPRLRDQIRRYFLQRNEDNPTQPEEKVMI